MNENGHVVKEFDGEDSELLEVTYNDGTVQNMEILIRFDRHDTGKSYIIVGDHEVEELEEVFLYRVEDTEDGFLLFDDLTEEEFAFGQEIIAQVREEDEMEDPTYEQL